MWDVGCGMRDVGCGMWDVGCGMWNMGCGMRARILQKSLLAVENGPLSRIQLAIPLDQEEGTHKSDLHPGLLEPP